MQPHLPHRLLLIVLLLGLSIGTRAQDDAPQRVNGIFFPTPMLDRSWHGAFGFVTFATPDRLTEEFRNRVPAGDIHLLRQVHGGLHLSARALVQVLQNHWSLGLRQNMLHGRWGFGLGADAAVWKGRLVLENFDTEARGWAFYPHASVGYRARHQVLLTLRTEAIFKLNYRSRVGDFEILRDVPPFNGMAYSLYVEQPFFGKHHLALGLTFRHTSFFWATWALFDTYDEPLLYRQITIAFIP
jgi:hypothetical protein